MLRKRQEAPGSRKSLDREAEEARRRAGGGEVAEATGTSRPQYLLDQVAGNGVEEEAQHEQQQRQAQELEDQPAVVVPDEVTNGLQGAEKPH